MDLFGTPEGKRVEVIQWGLRKTVGDYLADKGDVDLRPSEENARALAGVRHMGHANTEVVRRVVITYTSKWESP